MFHRCDDNRIMRQPLHNHHYRTRRGLHWWWTFDRHASKLKNFKYSNQWLASGKKMKCMGSDIDFSDQYCGHLSLFEWLYWHIMKWIRSMNELYSVWCTCASYASGSVARCRERNKCGFNWNGSQFRLIWVKCDILLLNYTFELLSDAKAWTIRNYDNVPHSICQIAVKFCDSYQKRNTDIKRFSFFML